MSWVYKTTLSIGSTVAGVLACLWLRAARRKYAPSSRELTPFEREAMRGWFSEDLLASVRIAETDGIELPWVGLTRRILGRGMAGLMDGPGGGGPGGIALGDLVVIRRRGGTSVLFHELVHIAQYQALGTRRFLTLYLRTWWESGRNYFAIPFEEEAYSWQEHYDGGADKRDIEAVVRKCWGRRST